MNETICNVMLFGGIALAVVFAVIAVILFVKLDIPKVIGDLSGSTARKQIKEIREKGYESLQGSGASKKDAMVGASFNKLNLLSCCRDKVLSIFTFLNDNHLSLWSGDRT